jgi:hypothetical protein
LLRRPGLVGEGAGDRERAAEKALQAAKRSAAGCEAELAQALGMRDAATRELTFAAEKLERALLSLPSVASVRVWSPSQRSSGPCRQVASHQAACVCARSRRVYHPQPTVRALARKDDSGSARWRRRQRRTTAHHQLKSNDGGATLRPSDAICAQFTPVYGCHPRHIAPALVHACRARILASIFRDQPRKARSPLASALADVRDFP